MIATPNAQSSALTFSVATLRTVLAKGQAAHPELACRMERAALIVVQRRISPAMAAENQGTCYWVEASDGAREYWVTLDPRGYRGDRCTCPDATQRGNPCKHSIAVRLLQKCETGGRGPEPPPIPFPARTLTDDEPIPFELTEKALAALDAAPPTTAA
jgi:hypothetical protein